MMAVTSEALLKFIAESSKADVKFDQDQQVVYTRDPVLSGEPLATALKQVADLAAHETGLGFARDQFEESHNKGSVFAGGPRPVN